MLFGGERFPFPDLAFWMPEDLPTTVFLQRLTFFWSFKGYFFSAAVAFLRGNGGGVDFSLRRLGFTAPVIVPEPRFGARG